MKPFLTLENLCKQFPLGGNSFVQAAWDVSFTIHQGETLGIVGESGCGKSTLARMIMGIHQPDSGNIYIEDKPLQLRGSKARLNYAKKAQMIFQDPYTSLDPRMTAASAIGENLQLHYSLGGSELQMRIVELLEQVGLDSSHLNRFPHEFSGGQRQRIGIARALAANPKFLVCDEPVSALDISIQSQIMNLLQGLKNELGLTYLFISHDLHMIRYISDRIAIMYSGRIVEIGCSEDICTNPQHPYTKMLLSAILPITPSDILSQGDKQDSTLVKAEQQGCPFYPRCPKATDICKTTEPKLMPAENRHIACHHY